MAKLIISRSFSELLYKITGSQIATDIREDHTTSLRYASLQPEIDYLDISQDDPLYLSYAPAKNYSDLTSLSSGPFTNCSLRIKGKPSKVLRKIFGDTYTSNQYERFAAAFTEQQRPVSERMTFELVTGDRLLDYYARTSYAPTAALDLANSCMAYPEKRPFLALYATNPDQCQLAVLLDARGKVHARALVWFGVTLDGSRAGHPCYDRIYHGSIEARAEMIRQLQALSFINICNGHTLAEISLNITGHLFPYIDTFRYSDDDGNFTSDTDTNTRWVYGSTAGSRQRTNGCETCNDCGRECQPYDLLTLRSGRRLCSNCGVYVPSESQYYPTADTVYSNYHGEEILARTAVHCFANFDSVDPGMYVLPRYARTTQDGRAYLTTQTVTTLDGKVFHKDDVTQYVPIQSFTTYGGWGDTGSYLPTFENPADLNATAATFNLVRTVSGRWIRSSQAAIFEGATYHRGEMIETATGDRFPLDLINVRFTKLEGRYGHSFVTIPNEPNPLP